ncbi:MAG: hypothetical protein J6K16_05955, partial [Alphaproteobacteria bacterium]|nr:hypothetical protein [Alphaproteobacteria bacterium]
MFVRTIALLSAVFYTTSAVALTLKPTLDTLKTEAGSLSGNYALTELGENTLPDGAEKVTIDGVVYYFIPSDSDANLLSILAGTSAGSLIADTNGIFEYNGTKYSFNTNAIPNSAFSYGEGSETDYNFTTQTADSVGNLTTSYHKINLKPEEFSTSPNIYWSEVDETKKDENNVIEVQLPNEDTRYYQYAVKSTVTLNPVLDTLKTRAGSLSGNYALTELGENTLPDGAEKVTIDGVVYYFTPSSSDASLLSTLAGTSAGSLIADTNGIFEYNGTKYSFNTNAIPNSAFSYGEGSETDYNFKLQDVDNESNIVTKYYKINLNPDNFSASPNISWTEVDETKKDESNVVTVQLPNNQTKYYQYAYTMPSNYTETSTRTNSISNTESVTNKVFKNIENSSYNKYGGAVYNGYDNYTTGINSDFINNNTSHGGGAIANEAGVTSYSAFLGNITGNFIGNSASDGGAVYTYARDSSSTAKIDYIKGNFISNYASSQGGAIYNYSYLSTFRSNIENIMANFVGNYASSEGGAIYNYHSTIGNISGNFIGNYAASYYGTGGAIYNDGVIGNITGDFIGNYAQSTNSQAMGGAIYNGSRIDNMAIINNITGDFINNYVYSTKSIAYGGAIHNEGGGSIGNITGDFIANYALSADSYSYGGAIYNDVSSNNVINIGDITGNFIANYASSGGAIYNYMYYDTGTINISSITGDFIGNYGSSLGGAIYNDAPSQRIFIGSITGDFIGNNIVSKLGQGGAIYNKNGNIGKIEGDFINNYALLSLLLSSSSSSDAYGGAIYNGGTIGDIIGDFVDNYIDNHVKSSGSSVYIFVNGGAIYNNRSGNIYGDFIGNHITTYMSSSSSSSVISGVEIYGGAIYSSNSMENITGSFIGNYIYYDSEISSFSNGHSVYPKGGAVYNTGSMGDIAGDFIGNYISSTTTRTGGGAIYNGSYHSSHDKIITIESIVGDFIGNYTKTISGTATGGAIYNEAYSSSYLASSVIGSIKGNFINNYASGYSVYGGAITNIGTIKSITGNIINNHAQSTSEIARGGAIYNNGKIAIDAEDGIMNNYIQSGSSSARGGFLYNESSGEFGNIDADIINNYAESGSDYARGGAIYNAGTIGNISGNIIGNYAKSTTGTAQGGAIYNTSTMGISADNSTLLIKDNYVEDKDGKRAEAVYMGSSGAKLTLSAVNNGSIEVHDIITGTSGYDLTLTGDGTGYVSLFNDITNAEVIANNVDVVLANGTTKDYKIYTLTSDSTVGWNIDFDITNRKADKIIVSSTANGLVVLDNLNIIKGTIADLETNQVNNPFKIQILQTMYDKLQLSLSDNVKSQLGDREYIIGYINATKKAESIASVTNWSKDYQYTVTSTGTIYGKLGLATTKTTNDSIGLTESRRGEGITTYETMGDTLKLVAKANIGDRSFTTDNANANYILSEDIGTVAGGKLDIIGATSGDDKSSIDMNDKQGFNLTNTTELTFKDVDITNAKNDSLINVSNSNAKVNIDNANIDGNISGSVEYAMSITGTSNINGNINKANVTATDAVLSFGENTFASSKLTTNGGSMLLNNNSTANYTIGTLTAGDTTNWSIDFDVSNREADKIITSNASSGMIVLDNLNIINGKIADIVQNQTTKPFIVQILQTQNDSLQLALSDAVKTKLGNAEYIIGIIDASTTAEEIANTTSWDKVYQNTIVAAGTIYGKLGLATTKTENDSIGITESRRDGGGTTYESMGDTLKLVAEANIGDRSFETADATAEHTLSEDIGTVASGGLDIIGATSGANKSSIDMNDKQGFNLTNTTELTFKDVSISNAKDDNLVNVSNSNAKVNIDNADIDGNISGSVEYAMSVTGTANINGNISNADVTATDSVLSFGENTFASSKLTTVGGSVNLNNGDTDEYTIDTLNAGDTTNWSIDFDVGNKTADKIITNNASSGKIVLDNLNIINGKIADISSEQIGTEFIVQILDTQNSDLQLDLSDYVKSQLGNEKYVIGRQTDYFDDEVQQVTRWSDIYNRYSQLSEMFGKLGLATTDTENDSIGITYYETIIHDKELVGSLGDTLSLVSAANIDGREFNSMSADEEYVLTADLDTVAGGKFAINGKIDGEKRSTLDMNNKRGFNINNATELSFNNVAIEDASSYLVNINNADAVVNMTNVDVTNANISGSGQLNISANGTTSSFDDSSITLRGGALNLKASNGGLLTFNDGVTVLDNDINVSGDSSGEVKFNDNIITTGNFVLSNVVTARFGLNSKLNAQNMFSKGGATLKFDVKANPASNKMELATLTVNEELSGSYGVIINSLNQDKLEKAEDVKTPFLYALNDTDSNDESFDVLRVIGSPYLWDAVRNANGETNGSTWYFTLKEPINQLGPIKVAPEVIGFEAVTSAGLSQTNGMVYNIMRKVGVNRLFCPGCGFYDYNWDGEAFHNAWVDTTYNGLTIEAPVEIDANVWGIEAGSDLQHDLNNKLGIFASYRQGNYEMDGKGEKYYSTIGSEIDIDSYLAGLYYRYDHNNWYAFATVYGGMQEAEIKTDDGVSADTDGIEFGGSVEGGYNYALTRSLSVTPSLGVFYSQINYDDATDSAGKTVEYNDLKQVEIEAGA